MSKRLIVPAFASEAEEAAWHDAHMREIEDEISRQVKAGTAIVVDKGEIIPKPSRWRRRAKRTKSRQAHMSLTQNDLRILRISLKTGIEKGVFRVPKDKAAAEELRDRIDQTRV